MWSFACHSAPASMALTDISDASRLKEIQFQPGERVRDWTTEELVGTAVGAAVGLLVGVVVGAAVGVLVGVGAEAREY